MQHRSPLGPPTTHTDLPRCGGYRAGGRSGARGRGPLQSDQRHAWELKMERPPAVGPGELRGASWANDAWE